MQDEIRYLNTDLDLISADDLTDLAAALESSGVPPLHVTHHEDGKWYATFEVERAPSKEPEPDLSAMLDAIESLPRKLRTVWNKCSLREFNIGYDCGKKPWAFNQGLAVESLGRMAALKATLRITIYPSVPPLKITKARLGKKK